ncbi:uncharacterized protein [Prorops nasuta]|uniref:uncharacterized protein n=1 Tax=Prorops nasuta TaxID=863751 RepID=UPI0034CEF6B6
MEAIDNARSGVRIDGEKIWERIDLSWSESSAWKIVKGKGRRKREGNVALAICIMQATQQLGHGHGHSHGLLRWWLFFSFFSTPTIRANLEFLAEFTYYVHNERLGVLIAVCFQLNGMQLKIRDAVNGKMKCDCSNVYLAETQIEKARRPCKIEEIVRRRKLRHLEMKNVHQNLVNDTKFTVKLHHTSSDGPKSSTSSSSGNFSMKNRNSKQRVELLEFADSTSFPCKTRSTRLSCNLTNSRKDENRPIPSERKLLKKCQDECEEKRNRRIVENTSSPQIKVCRSKSFRKVQSDYCVKNDKDHRLLRCIANSRSNNFKPRLDQVLSHNALPPKREINKLQSFSGTNLDVGKFFFATTESETEENVNKVPRFLNKSEELLSIDKRIERVDNSAVRRSWKGKNTEVTKSVKLRGVRSDSNAYFQVANDTSNVDINDPIWIHQSQSEHCNNCCKANQHKRSMKKFKTRQKSIDEICNCLTNITMDDPKLLANIINKKQKSELFYNSPKKDIRATKTWCNNTISDINCINCRENKKRGMTNAFGRKSWEEKVGAGLRASCDRNRSSTSIGGKEKDVDDSIGSSGNNWKEVAGIGGEVLHNNTNCLYETDDVNANANCKLKDSKYAGETEEASITVSHEYSRSEASISSNVSVPNLRANKSSYPGCDCEGERSKSELLRETICTIEKLLSTKKPATQTSLFPKPMPDPPRVSQETVNERQERNSANNIDAAPFDDNQRETNNDNERLTKERLIANNVKLEKNNLPDCHNYDSTDASSSYREPALQKNGDAYYKFDATDAKENPSSKRFYNRDNDETKLGYVFLVDDVDGRSKCAVAKEIGPIENLYGQDCQDAKSDNYKEKSDSSVKLLERVEQVDINCCTASSSSERLGIADTEKQSCASGINGDCRRIKQIDHHKQQSNCAAVDFYANKNSGGFHQPLPQQGGDFGQRRLHNCERNDEETELKDSCMLNRNLQRNENIDHCSVRAMGRKVFRESAQGRKNGCQICSKFLKDEGVGIEKMRDPTVARSSQEQREPRYYADTVQRIAHSCYRQCIQQIQKDGRSFTENCQSNRAAEHRQDTPRNSAEFHGNSVDLGHRVKSRRESPNRTRFSIHDCSNVYDGFAFADRDENKLLNGKFICNPSSPNFFNENYCDQCNQLRNKRLMKVENQCRCKSYSNNKFYNRFDTMNYNLTDLACGRCNLNMDIGHHRCCRCHSFEPKPQFRYPQCRCKKGKGELKDNGNRKWRQKNSNVCEKSCWRRRRGDRNWISREESCENSCKVSPRSRKVSFCLPVDYDDRVTEMRSPRGSYNTCHRFPSVRIAKKHLETSSESDNDKEESGRTTYARALAVFQRNCDQCDLPMAQNWLRKKR